MTGIEETEFYDLHPPILSVPQFTTGDVEAVTRLTAKALEHMLDPQKGRVRLSGLHVNPGRGKRRLFTGEDVLMIETARVMSGIGFPQRWSHILTDQVITRAKQLVRGKEWLVDPRPLALAMWPSGDGEDWAFAPIRDHAPDGAPAALQTLDVDRLISETMDKLQAVLDGREVPDYAPKPEVQQSPYSPQNDFFRMWAKDEAGRDIYVGLTYEETLELDNLRDLTSKTKDQKTRAVALHDRHETARQNRIAAEREMQNPPEPTQKAQPNRKPWFWPMKDKS